MVVDINNISQEGASLATQLDRMQIVPAFDAEAQILEAIRALSERMDDRFTRVNDRFTH
jgi:hypothetical protein